MKNIIILIFIINYCAATAQNLKNSVFINYKLSLDEKNSGIYSKCLPKYSNQSKRFSLTYSNLHLKESQTKQIIDNFLSHIKTNKNVSNKIYGFNNAPINGLEISLKDAAKIYSDDGSYTVIANSLYEPKTNQLISYNKKSKTYFIDKKKPLIKFSEEKQNWHISDINHNSRKYIIEPKSDFNNSFFDNINGLEFFESWNIDAERGTFTKEIITLGLTHKCDYNNNQNNFCPLFNFSTNKYTKEILEKGNDNKYIFKDINMVADNVIYSVIFSFNSALCNKNNYNNNSENYNSYCFIEPIDRYYFIYLIFKSIKNKKVKVYNLKFDTIIKSERFTIYDIDTITKIKEEVLLWDEWTGENFTEIVKTSTNLSDIAGFKFYEVWYFDNENFSFYKKVKGVSLIYKTLYNEDYIEDEIKYTFSDRFYIEFN